MRIPQQGSSREHLGTVTDTELLTFDRLPAPHCHCGRLARDHRMGSEAYDPKKHPCPASAPTVARLANEAFTLWKRMKTNGLIP